MNKTNTFGTTDNKEAIEAKKSFILSLQSVVPE